MNKHKKSQYFFTKGLFTNLSSFFELEDRIIDLPEIERGDAFEVFAEAYFNTQVIQQAQEVWPEKILPQNLRDKFGISVDAGVDGIFKTNMGLYKAYQVKFRSNRNALTWDNDGLGKFFGQTDRVDERVLFTNSVDLSFITNTRVDFYSIKGNDLDCLTQQDFQIIENWFHEGVLIKQEKNLGSHQIEAVDKILTELRSNHRATTIMACGTGKTLVALSVAEKIGAQTILVLLPSLALIRQTLHDWAKDNNWDSFNFLCVCSDNTVIANNDEIVLQQYDLDFPVTTEKSVVERFLLNQNIHRKIIFSTYQSSQIVAQATPQNFTFDLAIFDEAHKTASRQGANYAFALQDKNLLVKKRLFLTATPRHYNVNKRDKQGKQQIVFSMDNESIYGKVAYSLSFREAVKRGIICDYKVIISVVTSDEVNRQLLKQGEVVVHGDIIKAQRIANILAVQNAVEKHGLKKIFSFHSSVSAAKSFTVKTNEGIGAYLEDFSTEHVSGIMSTNKRSEALEEFKKSQKAVISNARCLTEGVNVPAVDMVAFISPKKSRVDIVQATGRAMRKDLNNPDKIGYILIPIFLQISENECIEEALQRTQFETIWDVLQAMQEQDESLAEIIAQLRENRSKSSGMNDNRLREQVEVLGPELFLRILKQSITTQIVDKLGSDWDDRLGELIQFKEKFGHCNVSRTNLQYVSLGRWVSLQRGKYFKRRKELLQNQILRLEAIGFNWDPVDAEWDKKFNQLIEYRNLHGHCNVYQKDRENLILGRWVSIQRRNHIKNRLSPQRILKLDSLGFDWDPVITEWHKNFEKLVQYKNLYGHCNVSKKDSNNLDLGRWVGHQRERYRNNDLEDWKIIKLNSLEFVWNPIDIKWLNRFNELVQYNQRHGHCNVSKNYNIKLGEWVGEQRYLYKEKKLSDERIEELNSIGFIWDFKESLWYKQYDDLVQYKKKYGHCNVPNKDSNYLTLGAWVGLQRKLYKQNKLAEKRVSMLNQIGFIWDPLYDKWMANFELLVIFKNTYGHTNVPKQSQLKSYPLGIWCRKQKNRFKKSLLLEIYIEKLNSIDFEW